MSRSSPSMELKCVRDSRVKHKSALRFYLKGVLYERQGSALSAGGIYNAVYFIALALHENV